jgi:hypothetical protein
MDWPIRAVIVKLEYDHPGRLGAVSKLIVEFDQGLDPIRDIIVVPVPDLGEGVQFHGNWAEKLTFLGRARLGRYLQRAPAKRAHRQQESTCIPPHCRNVGASPGGVKGLIGRANLRLSYFSSAANVL